jgi:hypothetical protein
MINDCKTNESDINIDKQKNTCDYECKVYQLLNDAYKRNPKANYKGEDAYININHNLNNSYGNIKKELLNELLQKAYLKVRPAYLFDKKRWASQMGLFQPTKFSQEQIEIPNLHFKEPNVDDIEKYTFFINIDGIMFNNDYAILATNLYESLFFLSLYKLEDGTYKSIISVNYPPSADE